MCARWTAFASLALTSALLGVSAHDLATKVSAGGIGKTMISIDGDVLFEASITDYAYAAAGTRITWLKGSNFSREGVAPVADGLVGTDCGLLVALPSCGQASSELIVVAMPDNCAEEHECGAAGLLRARIEALPSGTPVVMATSYNKRGWAAYSCPEDVRDFQAIVSLLGGSYGGSLGPAARASFDGYKSAYVLMGHVNATASDFEMYCPSYSGSGAHPRCSDSNGGWIRNETADLYCSGPLLL